MDNDINFKYEIKNKKVITFIKNFKFDCNSNYNSYKVESFKLTNHDELTNLKLKEITMNYIHKNVKKYCVYKNIYKKNNIELIIYSPTKDNIKLVNEINSIINLFKNFYIPNKKINIKILLIDKKR